MDDPKKTVCFQNDHIPLMNQYRDAGPTYPFHIMDEYSVISICYDAGQNDETVISVAPGDLPKDWKEQLKKKEKK